MDEKYLSITAKKKQIKENQLFTAAYDLFLMQDIGKTSIDDIVKKAGVAKGTFYLYFKDKNDLLHRLILKKSNEIMKAALEKTNECGSEDFKIRTITFIDYIINYLKDNVSLLNMINKNISWGIYRSAIMKPEEYNEVQIALNVFINNLTKEGMDRKEAELTLFMIIELLGSVCYTTIILKEPTDIDTIKPLLFKKILSMIEN